jgi:glycosyltransferase involved in cell wall biosynthesis
MKSIDIVIPAYNEEECIDELVRRLRLMFDENRNYEWRIILVENGSIDNTWTKALALAEVEPRLQIVRLARNFHMDGGLTAGLEFARADALVFMTADLQDPPEAIPKFVAKWEEGYENVYGEVVKREGTGPVRRFNSWAFYKLATYMTSGRMPRNASDFRLMDRRLYEVVRSMDERNRFMRGLVAWAGFSSAAVPVPRPPRFAGESKAYSLPVIGLAFRALFAHSYLPLRLITGVGFAAAITSLVLLAVFTARWLIVGVPFAGFGSLLSLVLLIFGVTSLMLGVIAEYISLIYEEVKHRPNFIVREVFGLD